MLFPYGTDAPIYFRPFATVVIIVMNVIMFAITGMGDNHAYRWLILEFNQINPLQWVTAAFMHASWIHLVGNMIFLWCFGIVVEGKIGWRRFSMLYLGLALADGAVGQIPMFFLAGSMSSSGALGASGVIFALIAIAMVWAPENKMSCLFVWSFLFVKTFEIPIFALAAFYIAVELLQATLTGFSMSSAMLHLLGMSVGFPFAIFMLRRNLVDCEGYDWFSRHSGICAQFRSWNPLAMFGGMLFGTPARNRAQLELDKHSDRSGQDALSLIKQHPSRFNPKPAPLVRRTSRITETSVPNAPVKQAKRAQTQFSQPIRTRIQTGARQSARQLVDAIEMGDVVGAQRSFAIIKRHSRLDSLPSKVIGHYCNLLSRHGEHLASMLPLEILVDRGSRNANQACLQLALIHWQLRQDRDAARHALDRIKLSKTDSPNSRELGRRKRRLLAKIQAGVQSTTSRNKVKAGRQH